MTTKREIIAELEAAGVEFDEKATKAELEKLLASNSPTEDEGDETPKASKSAVPDKYKKRYGKSQNCGDEMAEMLATLVKDEKGVTNIEALNAVGAQNGIDVQDRWGTGREGGALNVGMQRMNLSNVLRGKIRNEERVVVGEHVYNEGADEAAA